MVTILPNGTLLFFGVKNSKAITKIVVSGLNNIKSFLWS